MARFCVGLGAMLSVIVLAACGAEPAENSQPAGDVAALSGGTSGQIIRACDLLDLTAATRVIGSGTEQPGGDMEELTCMYSNPGVAVLTIQLGGAELYDQITILPPHTSVQIGDQGRYNVQGTGTAAVQFAKGAYSVTISVQPFGTSQAAYMESLLAAAREAAGRLP